MSSTIRRISEKDPLRLVQVGAGGMGRAWLRNIEANPDVELVGLVDLDLNTAHAALSETGREPGLVAVGTSVAEVAAATGAHAVVNVTVPVAHLPVNREALAAGLPVLCEKPAAQTVAEAYRQAAAARVHGQLLMISQSRRYYAALDALRGALPALGEIGTVVTEFYKGIHFGGFREEMEHVLLVDMAIHQFDMARSIIGRRPIAVYCEEHNPGWSWYRGAANAHAVFEFEGGTRYVFTGSWCSPGDETAWNGLWRVNGEHGTVRWDGDAEVIAHRPQHDEAPRQLPLEPGVEEEISGSLAEFVACLRSGETPANAALENIQSLAMVEAAVRSAETGQRVRIDEVLRESLTDAISDEPDADVRAELNQLDA